LLHGTHRECNDGLGVIAASYQLTPVNTTWLALWADQKQTWLDFGWNEFGWISNVVLIQAKIHSKTQLKRDKT